jgi:hypothetical protein
MNILTALKNDHKELKSLLEQIADTTERAGKTRDSLFRKFKKALARMDHQSAASLSPGAGARPHICATRRLWRTMRPSISQI